VSGRQGAAINMSQVARWAAAGAALLVMCSLASCSTASVSEGIKWSKWPIPSAEAQDDWQKVTAVLQKAKENSTFPGISYTRTD